MKDLNYRYFYFKNYRDEILDITGQFNHTPFLSAPTGLGMSWTLTTEQIESKLKLLNKAVNLDTINGTMLFDTYVKFEAFKEYIRLSQANGNMLKLYYATTDMENQFYYECIVSNLQKGEKQRNGQLACPIIINKMSNQLNDKLVIVSNQLAYQENITESQARITVVQIMDYAVSFAVLKPKNVAYDLVLVDSLNEPIRTIVLPETREVSDFVLDLTPDTNYSLILKSASNSSEANFKTTNKYVEIGAEGGLIQTSASATEIGFKRYYKAVDSAVIPTLLFMGFKNNSTFIKKDDLEPTTLIKDYLASADFGIAITDNNLLGVYLDYPMSDLLPETLGFTALANPTLPALIGAETATEYPNYVYPVGTSGVKYKLYGYSSITTEFLKLQINSRNYGTVACKITINGSFVNPKWESNRFSPYSNSSIPMSGSYNTADGNGVLIIDSNYRKPQITLNGLDLSAESDKSLSEFLYVLPGYNEITFNITASSVTTVSIEYQEEKEA